MNTSLISAKQFVEDKQLNSFFKIVDEIQWFPKFDRVMASLFYEPSTRTRFSFESAMHRLGGHVISESNSANLSVSKGESLEDTIHVVSQYADVLVLRHAEKGAAQKAIGVSECPVINAGDGAGEHPTQALLDMYTIRQNFNFDGLTVLLCGDLKNGRTIHSLATLLSLYKDVRLICCSPFQLMMFGDLVEWLKYKGMSINYYRTLEEGLVQKPDIVYMTRLQKERLSKIDYLMEDDIQWSDYCLTPELMRYLGEKALVLHPLPRNEELAGEVDNDPRCVYFSKQVKNGMKVRMGLLYILFSGQVCYTSPL